MAIVYVLSKDGKPLMPTTRCGHVRILLKQKKAQVVTTKPFTIRLTYDTEDRTQPLTLGIDPGRTNIGFAVVTDDGSCVFQAELITRNKDIPKLMAARKIYRQAHRRLKRRNKRRRRAATAGTTKAETFERLSPGCGKPIICHDIRNKEARFNNRVRPKGWLTPTANHLLLTHLNAVCKIQKFLPLSKIVLEINKFSFMEMDNPNIQKWQFQKGPLYGKGSVKNAVFEVQDGKCLLCGGEIEHYHHVTPKHKGGSDTLSNIVGLCSHCHGEVHTNSKTADRLATLKVGMGKKYGALSVLNQIIPKLTEGLSLILPTYVTDGKSTKAFRDSYNIDKRHSLDAYCIACSVLDIVKTNTPIAEPMLMRQFRRHDRQACHQAYINRVYTLDGKTIATNRHRATEQKTVSLEEYRNEHPQDVSKLIVKEHPPRYKNLNRVMPGALMTCGNTKFILQGSSGTHNGLPNYYISTLGSRYIANKCITIQRNQGIVMVS